jgi:elongator complex protein 3
MVPIGKQPLTEWQHRGIGERLLREAENITLENGCKNLAVISGVGVRDYYRNMGYRKKRYYMVKKL